ncbi:MAG: rhodanese-like domain-containing protein [Saprospiraceae bacterium]|nr:rhodanese-like domain-containing protein [Saprospiraceae bacterium]
MMKYTLAILLLTGLMSLNACGQSGAKPKLARIDVQQAIQLIQSEKNLQIVDVRTPGEVAATGVISNAVNFSIASADFSKQIDRLDKNKPVLVYCASGVRSAQAAAVLEKKGFLKVYDLSPGISGWLRANQKTTSN